jgi:heme exporter protein A
MIAGALKPTSGTLAVDRIEIGLVTHRTLLYDDLSALENLVFFAKLHDVPEPTKRALEELAAAGLADRAHDPIRTFSRGMQQRVALARALVHDPQLLLLDEPATGLDARSSERLRATLAARADRVTWVIASHDVEEGLALSRRWVLLDFGRVVASGGSEGQDADRARTLVRGAA